MTVLLLLLPLWLGLLLLVAGACGAARDGDAQAVAGRPAPAALPERPEQPRQEPAAEDLPGRVREPVGIAA